MSNHSSKTCSIENCGKKHYGKSFCGKHYQRFLKYGDANRCMSREEIMKMINNIRRGKPAWNKGTGKPKIKKGHVMTPEIRKNMSLCKIGKKFSHQHRINLSIALRKKMKEIGRTGKMALAKSIRKCFEYQLWRTSIFQRDNYTCQLCGDHGARLQVDHYPKTFAQIIKENNIKSLEDAIECLELWDIKNNRTLCENCHKETPTYMKRLERAVA